MISVVRRSGNYLSKYTMVTTQLVPNGMYNNGMLPPVGKTTVYSVKERKIPKDVPKGFQGIGSKI